MKKQFLFIIGFFAFCTVFGQQTDSIPKTDADTVKAQYPGGAEAFADHLRDNFVFPLRCAQYGISGYVRIRFIVNTDGTIDSCVAVDETASCLEFTTEAIRVLKLTKWIPGQINGKFYKSYRIVPISLSIAGSGPSKAERKAEREERKAAKKKARAEKKAAKRAAKKKAETTD